MRVQDRTKLLYVPGRVRMRVNHILPPQRSALALVLLIVFGSITQAAETIRLRPGFATILKLNQSIGTVVVGDAKVIDATPQSDTTLVLTAKEVAGTTNVLILDEQGNEFFSATVTVSVQGSSVSGKVQIHPRSAGGGRQSTVHEYWAYGCTPVCARIEDKLEVDVRSRSQTEVTTTTSDGSEAVTRSQETTTEAPPR